MCSWPCDRAHMQTLDSKTCIEPLRPPHSQITILTTAFTSWISLNLIPGHSHCFFFSFFFIPGRCHGKSVLVKQTMTGRLFSFCENKRSHWDKPPPWTGPSKKGSGSQWIQGVPVFCARAGKSAAEGEAIHLAGWSLLDQDFSCWKEAKGKGEKERERHRVWGSPPDCIDQTTWSPRPSFSQIHT